MKTINHYKHQIESSTIPTHMKPSLTRWVTHGSLPANEFLRRLLANDYMGAMRAADKAQAHAFREWAVLFASLPAGCYGSRARVERWAEQRGLQKPVSCSMCDEPAHAINCAPTIRTDGPGTCTTGTPYCYHHWPNRFTHKRDEPDSEPPPRGPQEWACVQKGARIFSPGTDDISGYVACMHHVHTKIGKSVAAAMDDGVFIERVPREAIS